MGGTGLALEEEREIIGERASGQTTQTGASGPVTKALPNGLVSNALNPSGDRANPNLLGSIKSRSSQAKPQSFQGAQPLSDAQRDRARHLRRYSMSNKEYTPEEDDLKNRLALANERIEESGVDSINAAVYGQEGLLGANIPAKSEATGEKDAGPKAGKLKELGSLFRSIVTSKWDSSSYKKLGSDVSDVVSVLDEKITAADFSKVSGRALEKYNTLIKSCDDYIKNHKNP